MRADARGKNEPARAEQIVFVCNSLRMGGSQVVLLELAQVAVTEGYSVVVASRGGVMAPAFRDVGARLITLALREGVAVPDEGRLVSLAKEAVSLLGVLQLAVLCARRPTVLTASQPWPVAVASVAARLTRTPLVWLAHGPTAVEMPPPWMASVRQASLAWVGITPEVCRALQALEPPPRTEVRMIPNPVRLPPPYPGPARTSDASTVERLAIGLAATLTGNKRAYVESCIDAAERMTSERPCVELRIVGDGPLREQLQQAAARAMARSPRLSVRLLGAAMDPWAELAGCHLIVGMGLVALEAAVRGFAVLCASSDGIGGPLLTTTYDRLLDTNFTGRGLEPLTVEGLVRAMTQSLEADDGGSLVRLVSARHGPESAAQWLQLWGGHA